MNQKDLIKLLTFASIAVFAWIVFNVLHSRLSTTISEEVSMQISPITPSFNTQDVSLLKNRLQIQPILQLGNNASTTPTPTTPVQTLTVPTTIAPSPTVLVTPIPNSSSSGILQGGNL